MKEKNEIRDTIDNIFQDYSMPIQQIELTEKEQCRYFAILDNELESKLKNKKEFNLVSIGCGFPSELVAIKMLEKKYGIVIHYLGIENNEKYQPLFNKICDKNNNINFSKDATNINSYKNTKFDIILYRHPFLIDSSTASSEPHKKIIKNILPKIYNQNAAFIFSCYEKEEVNIVCNLLNKTKKLMPQCIFELAKNEMEQLPKLKEQKNARFFLANQNVAKVDQMTHREKYVITGRALYKVQNQLENQIEDQQAELLNQVTIKTVRPDNSIETEVKKEIDLLRNI